jgi:hypothetical protein
MGPPPSTKTSFPHTVCNLKNICFLFCFITFKLVYAVISGRAAKLSRAGCMLESRRIQGAWTLPYSSPGPQDPGPLFVQLQHIWTQISSIPGLDLMKKILFVFTYLETSKLPANHHGNCKSFRFLLESCYERNICQDDDGVESVVGTTWIQLFS